MTSDEETPKRSEPKCLGRGEEILLLKRKYRPYDLASMLESVMAIEAISSRMPRPSSHIIEKKLGLVRSQIKSGRVLSSRRIAKSRRGDSGLDTLLLQRLMRLDPEALPWCSSLIWELIRSGKLDIQNEKDRYQSFSKRAHNILHVRTLVFGVQRIGAPFGRSVTLHHLRCLVAIGTLDAIAALWMLLIQAEEGSEEDVLVIARHIPPALALFYRRPEGQRTAIILFARMRQLILDRVKANGYELSLCGYDLIATASQAVPWKLLAPDIPYEPKIRHTTMADSTLSEADKELIERLVRRGASSRRTKQPPIEIPEQVTPALLDESMPVHKVKDKLPDLPGDVTDWIDRSLPSLRRVGSYSELAPKWANPLLRPVRLINQPLPSGVFWGPKAIARFKEELGDFL